MELQARYGDHWSGQLVYDNEFFLGSGRESLAFQAAKQLGAPTFLDLDQTIVDSGDLTWRHLLYRGWVKFANDDLEVVLGRQRIALGRAQLWNPTDIFNLIPPLAVEADQRVGVDSVLARVKLADGLWAAAIVSPERHDHHPRSALRLELSQRQVDAGADDREDRPRLPAGRRLRHQPGRRGAARRADRDLVPGRRQPEAAGGPVARLHASRSARACTRWSSTSTTRTSSRASPRSRRSPTPGLSEDSGLRLVAASRAPQLVTFARNQTGVSFGYDLTPLLRGNVLWLHDWNGPSEALVPSLVWSPRSDLELSAGVQLYGGNGHSGEFGGVPTLWFVRADVFF